MLPDAVRAAVEHLQAEGQRVSVRAIHARIGGSFREITKYLREMVPRAEGAEMPAIEVLPVLRIDDHPDVQDVRARLRALESEGADLQRQVEEHAYTMTVLQVGLESLDNAVFLGQQPASALDKVRTALTHTVGALETAQHDLQAHQARVPRLQGLAREIEADAAAIVAKNLEQAYQKAVRHYGQKLGEAVEAELAMRELQVLARGQFDRTVLPHVEPMLRVMQPGQSVGLGDLFWVWQHDRGVQRLLDADA